jgi:hypothetical protein
MSDGERLWRLFMADQISRMTPERATRRWAMMDERDRERWEKLASEVRGEQDEGAWSALVGRAS